MVGKGSERDLQKNFSFALLLKDLIQYLNSDRIRSVLSLYLLHQQLLPVPWLLQKDVKPPWWRPEQLVKVSHWVTKNVRGIDVNGCYFIIFKKLKSRYFFSQNVRIDIFACTIRKPSDIIITLPVDIYSTMEFYLCLRNIRSTATDSFKEANIFYKL